MTAKTAKDFLLSVGLLAGTIIGAGIFSLPYIFKSAGLVTGFFYLALATAAYIIIHWMYAEIIQKTSGEHRFVGYAKTYLGVGGYWLAILITVIETILILTIYLVLSQSFGNLITAYGAGVEKMIIFWAIGSMAMFLSLRRMAWVEFLITAGMAVIIGIIFIFSLNDVRPLSVAGLVSVDWRMWFLPLAPVLFSLSGRQAIPALVKIRGNVKKSIFTGVALAAVVYALFVLSVLMLSPTVSQDAVTGLRGAVPAWTLITIGIFGVLSLLSSYITVGFDVYKSLGLDLRMPFWLNFLIVVFGPIALYFAGFNSFIGLVSFVGGIFLALEGIFIIVMWLKATKRSLTAPTIILLVIFAVALLYELLK